MFFYSGSVAVIIIGEFERNETAENELNDNINQQLASGSLNNNASLPTYQVDTVLTIDEGKF